MEKTMTNHTTYASKFGTRLPRNKNKSTMICKLKMSKMKMKTDKELKYTLFHSNLNQKIKNKID